jgi:hypothetical protein
MLKIKKDESDNSVSKLYSKRDEMQKRRQEFTDVFA